jgi:hypothetical protein
VAVALSEWVALDSQNLDFLRKYLLILNLLLVAQQQSLLMEVAVVVGKTTHLLHLRGIMKEVAMTDMEAHRVAITKVTAATIIITMVVQEAGTTGTVEVTLIATTVEEAATTDPTWYIYFLISVIYI